ncbi:MAG: histidine kinase [Gammaproteobacteria bacterium]|nr:histidine kinase [Gammaproteobacteria bacterium]
MSKISVKQLKRQFIQAVVVSHTATKNYKIAMFVLLLLHVVYNFSMMQAVVGDSVDGSFDDYKTIMLRGTFDSLLFLAVCHYFVRSYLKLHLVNAALTIRKILWFCLYLLIVSAVFAVITFAMGEISFLSYDSIEGLQSIKEALGEQIPRWVLGLIFISNSFIMLLGWSVVYLFWGQQIARKQLQQQVHQAQIQQLTNQLSPHFLFNSLNSIRALIYEDQDKAADSVTLLAELFRSHLQAHLKPQSSLEEEWRVTQQYLALEQIRLEERLDLTVELDASLMTQKLPTLTLLTLVENAIKHGISPSAKVGYIRVIAKPVDNKRWSLVIENSVNGQSNAQGTKTGLVNVYKRLDLMFGFDHRCHKVETNNQFSIQMELVRA